MITLLQLEYFRKLAATEHITNTAKELYISQTALSSMIIGLERELGTKLFDRSKRSIRLNEAGRLYLGYVNEVFQALENGSAALRDLSEKREKNVSVAVGSSLVWVPLFHAFHKKYPEYTLKQFNFNTAGLTKAIETMGADFLLAGEGDIPRKDLACERIIDDCVYLCVSEHHPLADRETVSLSELRELPFINLPIGTPWRQFCDQLFSSAGYSVRPILECDYTMRAPLIASDFGVALTSGLAKDVDLLSPNRYILISDASSRRPMNIYWNPKHYMSKAMRDFKAFCLNHYREGHQAEPEK